MILGDFFEVFGLNSSLNGMKTHFLLIFQSTNSYCPSSVIYTRRELDSLSTASLSTTSLSTAGLSTASLSTTSLSTAGLSTASLSTDRFIDSRFIDRPFYRQPVYRQAVLSTPSLSTPPFDRQVHFIDNSIFINYFTLA